MTPNYSPRLKKNPSPTTNVTSEPKPAKGQVTYESYD